MKLSSIIHCLFLTLCLDSFISPIAFAQGSNSMQANISRARQTLAELDALIDGIAARQAGGAAKASMEWKSLFDGKSLSGWERTDFAGGGAVQVEGSFRGGPAAVTVKMGDALSGFNWTGGELPKTNYEISLDVMKIEGSDFVCGLTFPVADSFASLILGGWGGTVVGISSIDGRDASENETTKFIPFPKDKWFHVVMRVTPTRLTAWLDEKKVIDQDIAGRTISMRPGEIYRSKPMGISTYQTSAAFRDIKIRRLVQ